MRYRALPVRILGTALCLLLPLAPAASQSYSFAPLPSVHLAGHLGLTMYNGTLDAQNLDRSVVGYGLGSEMTYQFNNLLGLGVGYNGLYHPRMSAPRFRNTVQGFLRVQHPYTRVGPYLKLGGQYTTGGARSGGGPVVGFGLNFITGGTYSLYQELTFNIVFPGDALDGTAGASSFDALGFFGAGLRITDPKGFFGRRHIGLGRISAPNPVSPGQPATFNVERPAGNPPQTTYTWDFGDGTTRQGTTVQHAFEAPGLYTVTVRAANGGVSKNQVRLIQVNPPVKTVPSPRQTRAVPVDLSGRLPKLPKPSLRLLRGYTWVIARYFSEAAANAVAAAYGAGTQVVRVVPGTPEFDAYSRITGTNSTLTAYLVTTGQYPTLRAAAADRADAAVPRTGRPWLLHMRF